MTIQELLLTISGATFGGSWLIVILTTLIQISPIKIHPWSKVLKWLGKKLCSDVIAELKEQEKKDSELASAVARLETKLQERIEVTDQRAAIACRIRILQFGDELMHGTRKHSKELFDQVLSDITEYEHYCDTHKDFKNNKTTLTTAIIKEAYSKKLATNDFL